MKDIARAGHVTRWHSVRTARTQTLAEHQYLVTMYAREMARRMYSVDLDPDDELKLVDYTLRHDTPELLMGDIPTPVKARIETLSAGHHNPLKVIEHEICAQFVAAKRRVDGTAFEHIAKLADLVDSIVFLNAEKTNAHGEIILEKLNAMFDARVNDAAQDFPEFDWSAARDVLSEALHGCDNQIEFE